MPRVLINLVIHSGVMSYKNGRDLWILGPEKRSEEPPTVDINSVACVKAINPMANSFLRRSKEKQLCIR